MHATLARTRRKARDPRTRAISESADLPTTIDVTLQPRNGRGIVTHPYLSQILSAFYSLVRTLFSRRDMEGDIHDEAKLFIQRQFSAMPNTRWR